MRADQLELELWNDIDPQIRIKLLKETKLGKSAFSKNKSLFNEWVKTDFFESSDIVWKQVLQVIKAWSK